MLFGVLGCDWLSPSAKLSGSDCKPRKLTRVDACVGEDRSFQECHFYYRATGVADRAWCQAMSSVTAVGGELAGCTWDSTQGWAAVPCSRYDIYGRARCFACVSGSHEATITHVYAYDAGCERGLEQVTCNVDPVQAAHKLGAARF